jgi:murein DD-endopeptidase MepM/ murein hydrolase activator NlpD
VTRPRPAVLLGLFSLITFLCAAQPGLPATLLVTSPATAPLGTPTQQLCLTGRDADFQYSWGRLDPKSGLFSYYSAGQSPLTPQIAAPPEAVPGELLEVEVHETEDVDSIVAEILGPKQQPLSRGIGFHPLQSTRPESWVVLLGVSNLTEEGTYELSVEVKSGTRTAVQISALTVNERIFHFERIALNAGLTQLRTAEDLRKIAQARELFRVLTTPHADALFEMDTIRNPLPMARRTSGYGDRRRYVYSNNSSDFSVHEGLDLAMPEGTPVPACGRGKVVLAEDRILTGNTVVIEHLPGLFSLYYHLSQILVKTGDVVEQGQVIGKVGQTGLATGPHLHWEIDAMGVPVDPDRLTAGPILDKTPESGEIGNGKESKGGE